MKLLHSNSSAGRGPAVVIDVRAKSRRARPIRRRSLRSQVELALDRSTHSWAQAVCTCQGVCACLGVCLRAGVLGLHSGTVVRNCVHTACEPSLYGEHAREEQQPGAPCNAAHTSVDDTSDRRRGSSSGARPHRRHSQYSSAYTSELAGRWFPEDHVQLALAGWPSDAQPGLEADAVTSFSRAASPDSCPVPPRAAQTRGRDPTP